MARIVASRLLGLIAATGVVLGPGAGEVVAYVGAGAGTGGGPGMGIAGVLVLVLAVAIGLCVLSGLIAVTYTLVRRLRVWVRARQ